MPGAPAGGAAGAGAGAAAGYVGWIGGVASHLQNLAGELSPAAIAQRREAKKARKRLEAGVGYGMDGAEKDTARSDANQQTASLLAAQQAGLARQQNAGSLRGGESAEANRAIAQEALAANAQNEANIQRMSNQVAQQEYANDMGLVDAAAARGRDHAQRQGKISQDATQGRQGESTAAAAQDVYQRRLGKVGGGYP
jgi:hypothetical protein